MSLAYIREYYKVPAKRGGRVRYTDLNGVALVGRILSADHHLRVRLDHRVEWYAKVVRLHPTWRVEYLAPEVTPV